MDDIRRKYRKLLSTLQKTGGLVIGYSGGCDSTLLAAAARDSLGEKSLGVMIVFETYPRREVEQALITAQSLDLPTISVEENMLSDDDFIANTPERCYYCKKKIFHRLYEIAQKHAFSFVADGANADDLHDDRPGRRAAREMGVLSPLEEAGLTKNEIRELSRRMNLPTWDKPSFACLATRIPYGTRIERVPLTQIDAAEQYLTDFGFGQTRVRLHGDIARIEVKADEIHKFSSEETRTCITREFLKIGFTHITLDLQGYRTGSMNTAPPRGPFSANTLYGKKTLA